MDALIVSLFVVIIFVCTVVYLDKRWRWYLWSIFMRTRR